MSVATSTVLNRVPARLRAGTWWASSTLLYVPALVILVPVFLIPTVLLLTMSFTAEPGGLTHYVNLFESDLVRAVFSRSLLVAALVTLISLAVALPFSAVALKASGRLSSVLYGAVGASLFFSVIVRAYAWLALLGHSGPVHAFFQQLGFNTENWKLVNSPTGVIIGMVQYGIPFMVLAISDVMRGIDPNLERAAATLGAGPLRRWVRVKLPLYMPGMVAGVTIVFVTSLGYFIIPAILGSPSEMMIGQLISQQVGTTLNWGFGAALASVLLLITFLIVIALQWVGRRGSRN